MIKIGLYLWQLNCNYKRDNTDTKFPLCKKSEDTTEHVLECEKAKKLTLSKENSKIMGERRDNRFTEKMKREKLQ